MPYPNHTPEEVAQRGERIYEQQIKERVEPGEKGRFAVIDIETGDYEIDESDLAATKRALAKRPDAVLYGIRIGHRAAYTLGGRFITRLAVISGIVTVNGRPLSGSKSSARTKGGERSRP